MVRVAVEHGDAARLALALEPPAGSRELDDDALRVRPRDARELERRERRGGVPAVVLAGHRELELDRLELLRAHDVRHMGEPRLEELCDLRARAERRVMVEVDVQQHRDLGSERGDRAVGLVALDDEPALPRAARCRRAAAISPPIRNAGSSPSRSRQKAIIAVVVVLPCAPATTIERRSDTSSASRSARGRPSTRPANAVETYDLPAGGRRRRLGRDRHVDVREQMGEVRRLVAVPAARPPRPTRARAARTRSCRRRRSRRSRAAYRRAAASSMSSSAILSAASGLAAARIAAPISASRDGIGEQRPRRARERVGRLAVVDDRRAACAIEVLRVLRLVVAGRVRGTARGSPAGPPPRAPRPIPRRARRRGRRRRARRRSRRERQQPVARRW